MLTAPPEWYSVLGMFLRLYGPRGGSGLAPATIVETPVIVCTPLMFAVPVIVCVADMLIAATPSCVRAS